MSAIEESLQEISVSVAELVAQGDANALSEVGLALAEIIAMLEKPKENLAEAITAGLRGLTIPAPKAPDIKVTVQPAQVTVMPAPAPIQTGWKLTITSRDGNGQVREISLTPEN